LCEKLEFFGYKTLIDDFVDINRETL